MEQQVKNDMINLIENSHSAVVCSIDEEGFPNTKTMFKRMNEGTRVFWFSSNVSSIRTQQWLKSSKACIYFSDEKNNASLMLTGHMQVYTDNEIKQSHWEKGDEKYYSLGPTDPDYCMLRFTATKGNYSADKKCIFHVDDDADTIIFKYDDKWIKE